MDHPEKDKDEENEQSPEAKTFEDALKQIVKIPKKELERREAEAKLRTQPAP